MTDRSVLRSCLVGLSSNGADTSCMDSKNCHRAPVVQKMNNVIQWINLYPVDKLIDFPNTCPLDCVAKSLEKFPQ